MKKLIVPSVILVSSILTVGCSSDRDMKKKGMNSVDTVSSNSEESTKTDLDRTISKWPSRTQLAVQEMMAKYGPPHEVSSERIIWNNQGPYKRIMVTKEEVPHDFPMPHMDFLEHTVLYQVPADKADELQQFDGSVSFYRTSGELSARCDLEGHNILTLNLSRDIIEGKKTPLEARASFGENVKQDIMGMRPAYVEKLQFEPQTAMAAAFPDTKVMPGSPNREAASDDKVTPDAEILATVMAVNMNEILAAAQASKKGLSKDVTAYAKMLQSEHGKNSEKAMKLSQSSGITPIDTMKVDQMKKDGAEKLASITSLTGKDFVKAYVNAMVDDHEKVIAMIDGELLPKAKNEKVMAHLKETREHVSMHLDQAKELQKKM
jgi:predicted outer membrane protein